jgi:hypothetical protein
MGTNLPKFKYSHLGISNIKNLDKSRAIKVVLSNTVDVYVLRLKSELRTSTTWSFHLIIKLFSVILFIVN